MIDITFNPPKVNIDLLDQQLRNKLLDKCVGISWDEKTLTVHLDDSCQQVDQDQVASIVKAHDPTQLTADQQVKQVAVADSVKLQGQLDADIAALKAINVKDSDSAYAAINQIAAILAVQLDAMRTKP